VSDVTTKEFKLIIAESKEPSVELIQLITQCFQAYPEEQDIAPVIIYFANLYGIKI